MKKLLLISVPFLLYGFDVQFNQTFTTELIPNELSTTLNIASQKKSEKEVLSSLDIYTKFMKKSDSVDKKQNRLSLYPQYKYKDGTSTLVGYRGTLNYKISSTKDKMMKEFFESFYEIKKDKDVSLSFSSLQWGFSKKMIATATDNLRLEAIKWSESYATTLSKELHKVCRLKNVGLNSTNIRPRVYANEVAMAQSSKAMSMPLPEKLQDEYTVNANILVECK